MPVESSKLWTLRLKRGTRTTLLFADPAHTLSYLKSTLLSALRSAPSSDPTTLPASPSEIEIGKPVSLFDLAKGFQLLDANPLDGLDFEHGHEVNGKGKAKSAAHEPSLRSLGVRENYVLAYRFRQEDEEELDETMGEDPGWHVEIPSFEDIYGVDNESDLGALPEYKG